MPVWAELTAVLAADALTPPGSASPAVAERCEQKVDRVQLVESIRAALHPDKARPSKAHRAFRSRFSFDPVNQGWRNWRPDD